MSGSGTRSFPPPYAATGDASADRLAFFHIIERLKTQKRTGWLNNNIPDAESISDHMYRMTILALCSSDPDLDTAKCIMLAIVHDLAEAQVGDITPSEGITKEQKNALEAEAMRSFVRDMLHNTPAAQRIEALWQEYEAGQTGEAKFVKDLDRIEMALQASEYEKRHGIPLQPFFDSSLPKIQHPEVQQWAADLQAERQQNSSKPPTQ